MKAGKIVLIFQAIITLFIGVAFFTQVLALDNTKIPKLKMEINQDNISWDTTSSPLTIDIKQRYTLAAYILLILGIFEILIISRLTH